jgi:transposase-like protein
VGVKRKQHSAEFKARVAMAALSGEKTLANRIGLTGIGGERFRHALFTCAQQRGQFAAGQESRVYPLVLVDEALFSSAIRMEI